MELWSGVAPVTNDVLLVKRGINEKMNTVASYPGSHGLSFPLLKSNGTIMQGYHQALNFNLSLALQK